MWMLRTFVAVDAVGSPVARALLKPRTGRGTYATKIVVLRL